MLFSKVAVNSIISSATTTSSSPQCVAGIHQYGLIVCRQYAAAAAFNPFDDVDYSSGTSRRRLLSSLSPSSSSFTLGGRRRSFHTTNPSLLAKVELLSLPSSRHKEGTVQHMLGIGTPVQVGDPIAVIKVSGEEESLGAKASKADNDDDRATAASKSASSLSMDDDENHVTIFAPHSGRITKHTADLKSTIKIGDVLLELSDDISIDKRKLHEIMNIGSTADQASAIDEATKFIQDIVTNEESKDDIFRLQQLIQTIQTEFPQTQLYPKSLMIYQRILELQQDQSLKEAQANTRTELGGLLFRLGDIEGCTLQLQAALDLRMEVAATTASAGSGSDAPSSATAHSPQQNIAASHIHLGSVYKQAGNFDKSIEHMKSALEIQKEVSGEDHPIIASSYNNIGSIYYQKGDYNEAIDHYRMALQINTKIHGDSDVPNADTAGTHHNLGVALKFVPGQYEQAVEHCQKAISMRRQLFEKDGSENANSVKEEDIAASHYALGQVWNESGIDLDGALEQFQAALAIQEKIYGMESPITATGYTNIGSVYYQQHKHDDALQQYHKGLTILQKVYGSTGENGATNTHPDIAGAMNNIGLTLYQKGEYEESLQYHTNARMILESIFGKESPNLATTIGSIGNVLKAQNKLDDALIEFRIAHQMLEAAHGTKNHPDVASSYNNIGLVLSQQDGKHDEALKAYESAKDAFCNSLGVEHPHTGSCHYNIGLVLMSKGDQISLDKAKDEFIQAKDIWATTLGENHPHTQMVMKSIQECTTTTS